ncbi:MAG: hypothetical protein ACRDFC_06985 [Ignavibacteria bacterium]
MVIQLGLPLSSTNFLTTSSVNLHNLITRALFRRNGGNGHYCLSFVVSFYNYVAGMVS